MLEVIVIIGVCCLVLGLIIAGNRQTSKRRAEVQGQIESLRAQMQAFRDQSQRLDPKTSERVGIAQTAVEEKLRQASGLLGNAVKENHFARIQRILTQVQAKLGNVQSSIGRAQTRAEERQQRQGEAEQRRAGSFGQKGAAAMNINARTGSFAPPEQTTGATTNWNVIAPAERGVCFFCSRPCLLRELTPVTVPIAGTARRVLACPQDFATVRAGTIPPIRAFAMNGQQVPWFAYNRYNPYNDYYPGGYGTNFYLDTYPIMVFDAGYWNFDGPYGYEGGQPYVFTPDAEPYRDYYNAEAAGAAAGVYNPNSPVPTFDPNDPNNAPNNANYGPDGQPIGPDVS